MKNKIIVQVPDKERKGCCKFDCENYPKISVYKKTGKICLDENGELDCEHNGVCKMCKFFKPFNFYDNAYNRIKKGGKTK